MRPVFSDTCASMPAGATWRCQCVCVRTRRRIASFYALNVEAVAQNLVTMALLDKNTTARYLTLPQPDTTSQVMYVWIDGSGENVRCKTKTVDFIPKAAEGMNPHLCCVACQGVAQICLRLSNLSNDVTSRDPYFMTMKCCLHLQNFLSGILTDQVLIKRRAQTLMSFCIQ